MNKDIRVFVQKWLSYAKSTYNINLSKSSASKGINSITFILQCGMWKSVVTTSTDVI